MKWPWARGKERGGKAPPAPAATGQPPSMAELTARAREEVLAQTEADPDWFAKLPYAGAMSRDQAMDFEVEKRALMRRVVLEAGLRPEVKALVWTTREDAKVCPQCAARHGRRYAGEELAALAGETPHLGCRCELIPQR